MTSCAVAIAERKHDEATALNSVTERRIAVRQLELVQDAASRIIAGHSYSAMRDSNRFDKELQKSVPCRVEINFRMDHVTALVSERVTNEIYVGLFRGEPLALRQMQKLVRECAEEIAFDALGFDSEPFLDIDALRDAAE